MEQPSTLWEGEYLDGGVVVNAVGYELDDAGRAGGSVVLRVTPAAGFWKELPDGRRTGILFMDPGQAGLLAAGLTEAAEVAEAAGRESETDT
ncbi:MAG TPA: hypothetical protein VFZ97_06690 [Acidimicrobiales bacterium]